VSARTRGPKSRTLPEWNGLDRLVPVAPTPDTKLRAVVLDARDAGRVSRWLRNHDRGDMPRHIRENMA